MYNKLDRHIPNEEEIKIDKDRIYEISKIVLLIFGEYNR